MTKQEIIKMFSDKDVDLSFNTDKYGSLQVVLRDVNDMSLIWRMWDYETDFAFQLERELNNLKDFTPVENADWDNEDLMIESNIDYAVDSGRDDVGSVIISKQQLTDFTTGKKLANRYVALIGLNATICNTLEDAMKVVNDWLELISSKQVNVTEYAGSVKIAFPDFMLKIFKSNNLRSKKYGKWIVTMDNKLMSYDDKKAAISSAIIFGFANYKSLAV